MVVTTEWMRINYDKYNAKYWGGKLPNISFLTNMSKKTWGLATYRYVKIRETRYNWNGDKIDYYDIKPISITLSNYFDSPEEVKLTTLLHEMIHIADYTLHPEHFGIVKNGRKQLAQYDSHGEDFFLPEARRLSADGWNIEKYVSEEERSVSHLSNEVNIRNQKKGKKGFIIGLFYYIDEKYGFMKTNQTNYEDLTGRNLEWFKKTLLKYPIYKVEWYFTHIVELASIRACNKGWTCYKYKTSELANKLRQEGTLLNTVNVNSNNNINSKPTLKDPNVIRHFKMPLINGKVIEYKYINKNVLFNKLKELFPKWSDEIINKQIENPKWTMKESKNININKIIREELNNFVQKDKGEDNPTANIGGTTHMFLQKINDDEGIVSIE